MNTSIADDHPTPNEGNVDRALRIALGAALFALAFVGPDWLAIVAVYPFVTGVLGRCPLYELLGFRTCTVRTFHKT